MSGRDQDLELGLTGPLEQAAVERHLGRAQVAGVRDIHLDPEPTPHATAGHALDPDPGLLPDEAAAGDLAGREQRLRESLVVALGDLQGAVARRLGERVVGFAALDVVVGAVVAVRVRAVLVLEPEIDPLLRQAEARAFRTPPLQPNSSTFLSGLGAPARANLVATLK